MIEKLSEYKITKRDGDYINADNNTKIINTLVCKINELVDAVNIIQEQIEEHEEGINEAKELLAIQLDQIYELQKQAENRQSAKIAHPDDPYAEQRKWIGKLCRFWNFKDGAVDIGVLKAVDNLKPTIPYINDIDCSYAYCEPVKPDDDIIFKGE